MQEFINLILTYYLYICMLHSLSGKYIDLFYLSLYLIFLDNPTFMKSFSKKLKLKLNKHKLEF